MSEGAVTRAAGPSHLIWTIGALSAFGPLSTDMYLPGLPSLTRSLHASASASQLTLTASVLGIAIGQVLAGPVSDARGRRLPLLSGLMLFSGASVLCAIAPTIWPLIIARFIQGMAGGTGIVIARAIVRDLYTGTRAARVFATTTTINGLAPILAPLIGAEILAFSSWRGVFVTLAGIGAALFLVTRLTAAETLPVDSRHSGGLRATLRTFADLLGDRGFAPAAASYSLSFCAMFAYISGGSYVLENIYHVSAQAFSVAFAVNATGIVLFALLSRRGVHRFGAQRLFRVGLIGVTAGAVMTFVVCAEHADLWLLLVGLLVLVSSQGLAMPNGVAVAMESRPDALGSASGLIGLGQFGLGAVVAPLVGLGGSHDAIPMVVVMLTSAVLALAVNLLLVRRAARWPHA